MLRRLLTLWLLLSTIGYGSLWALDGHFSDPLQADGSCLDAAHGEPGEDHAHGDHCGHATAHMTGIWSQTAAVAVSLADSHWPPSRCSWQSISTEPPAHPPRA